MTTKPTLLVHPERIKAGYKAAIEKISWDDTITGDGGKDTNIREVVAELRFQQIKNDTYYKYLFAAAGVTTADRLRKMYTEGFSSLKKSPLFLELLDSVNASETDTYEFKHLQQRMFGGIAKWSEREKLLASWKLGRVAKVTYKKLKAKMTYSYNKVWKEPVIHSIGEIPPQQAILVDCTSLFNCSANFGGSKEAMTLRGSMEACLRQGADEGAATTTIEQIPFVPTLTQQIKSQEALERREDFESAQRKTRPFSYNGMMVFNYFDRENHNKDAVLLERGRELFDDIEKLERLLGVILKCFGGCRLLNDSTMALKSYVMTALLTNIECRQNAHLDYPISALKGRRGRGKRSLVADGSPRDDDDGGDDGPFPWAADIPLSKGGMNLSVWHGYEASWRAEEDVPLGNWSMKLHVPFGWILLWRGDLVHAGGFQNALKNGALRAHWYIYMKQEDCDIDYGRHRTTSTDFESGEKIYAVCKHLEEADIWGDMDETN